MTILVYKNVKILYFRAGFGARAWRGEG